MNGIIVYIQLYTYIYIYISAYEQLLSFTYYPSIPLIIPISHSFIDIFLVRNLNYSYQYMLEHLELNYIDMNNYWFNYIFFVNDYSQNQKKSLTKQVIDQRSLPPGSPAQVLIRLCGTTVGSKALLSYQLSPRRRGNSPGPPGSLGKGKTHGKTPGKCPFCGSLQCCAPQ